MIISSKEQKLSPLLKYPGGKDKELIHILPNLPKNAQNYYEPFVGGGAVFFAINAKRYFINDKSYELMQLYSLVKDGDTDFLDKISQIDHNWNIIGSIVNNHAEEISIIYYSYKNNKFSKQKLYDEIAAFVLHNSAEFNGLLSPNFNIGIQNFVNELSKSFRNKIVRMVEIERKKGNLSKEDFLLNIECAFKSAFYMHFRYLYNNAEELGISSSFYIAIYFYIREFCYSSMFRYNNNGKFNVPYGGISYNKKSLRKKIDYFTSKDLIKQLKKTTIVCDDFQKFLRDNTPSLNDFIFLDPPYDTEFSTYAKNKFDKQDQERLADYLINECDSYFMLIIKSTDFVLNLYQSGKLIKNGRTLKVKKFSKKYMVSFQNRNDKEAEHLIITNY
ncbi:MAG: DNA adenine methylase [Oscillospiraceae bacterium]